MPRFKEETPFEKRVSECIRIKQKFPGRIPVIVERSTGSDIAEIDKTKFLVPSDFTVGQFIFMIRKRLILPPEKALFLFVNYSLPPSSAILKEVYDAYRDRDGFLYFTYTGESTFGLCN